MTCCNKHPERTEFNYRQVGPHIGVYCVVCNKWLKWLNKSERTSHISQHADVKTRTPRTKTIDVVIDNDDDDLPW